MLLEKNYLCQSEQLQMFRNKITRTEIDQLPQGSFNGEIVLIDRRSQVDRWMPCLLAQETLGFDTESRPTFKRGQRYGVSLLQVATSEKAFLFRLNLIGLPGPLKQVLADESIRKVGIAIHDDVKGLAKLGAFRPASFIDLQNLVAGHGIEEKSLRKLAGIVLGIKVSKSQQLTNWETPVLSPAQQLYAATDAWVCYELYQRLNHH